MQDERIIQLIAKSLDEPLTAAEQSEVDTSVAKSVALRLTAEGLAEFDALVKRTGMAIPAEGFPARVLARLEAYELRRSRIQWLLTLVVLFLGSLAAAAWLLLNLGPALNSAAELITIALDVLPVWYRALFVLATTTGGWLLVINGIVVLALTSLLAGASRDPLHTSLPTFN